MEQYLEFKNISKSFAAVKALDDISFRTDAGKILALVGENGAGKSTLLKILSGDLQADSGDVIISGEIEHFASPHDAIKAGVSVIYQERQLMPSMSIMENIYAGSLPEKKLGLIDKKALKKNAQALLDKFGLELAPETLIGRISVAHQQMVEIMKAYQRDSRIICFDEPTASLTDTEIEILFKVIDELKKSGKIIIYVSHRMAEIFQVSDDIVIFKDGKMVTKLVTAETNENELVRYMVGRDIGDTYSKLSRNTVFGDTILEVKNLKNRKIKDVSFSLKAGEVLGFSGLVGAGRTEVARAIFGADPIESGEIWLEGKKVSFKSPTEAIDAGIALCPEDRKEQGLVLYRPISDNITMPVLPKILKNGFLDKALEEKLANDAVDKYSIKTPTVKKVVVELSGGNQQKVILGRWTNEKMDTKILILDEPTKGIDVGTKAEIYQRICDFAKQGLGVILISSELPEIIGVSDRIIVMHDGRITGVVNREDATEEKILSLAMAEIEEEE